MRNVQSKKRWHFSINFDNISPIVPKDINNIFEMQGLLEHNDFSNKLAIRITHAMLIYIQ
jgi:hypothetical protein